MKCVDFPQDVSKILTVASLPLLPLTACSFGCSKCLLEGSFGRIIFLASGRKYSG